MNKENGGRKKLERVVQLKTRKVIFFYGSWTATLNSRFHTRDVTYT